MLPLAIHRPALHEPTSPSRRRSRPRPRFEGLSSRTRTSRRTIWFMVPMHAENRKWTLHEPTRSAGGQPAVSPTASRLSVE